MLVFPAIDITDTENSLPRQRALSHDPHIPWQPDKMKFLDLLGDGTVIVDADYSKTRIPGPKRRKQLDASLVYLEPVTGLGAETEEGILYKVHKDKPRPNSEDQISPLHRLIAITPDIEHRISMTWGTVVEIRLSQRQLLWLKMVMA